MKALLFAVGLYIAAVVGYSLSYNSTRKIKEVLQESWKILRLPASPSAVHGGEAASLSIVTSHDAFFLKRVT
jgi:CRISPR/Cas system-associated protein Cas5 (RAMP superfamily)